MAFLLGNQSCIESLRNDLNDIQTIVDDIVVTTKEPIKCYSWKSPDKLATDLKVKELIERFRFDTSDEIANQIAHYSLLELIVDRLLLIIALSSTCVDNSLVGDAADAASTNAKKLTSSATASGGGGASSSAIARLNAGLSVKKYWAKFTQLTMAVRHLKCQIKQNVTNQKAAQEAKPATAAALVDVKAASSSDEKTSAAWHACAQQAQTGLQQSADQIINMCHFHNLASNVAKYRMSLQTQTAESWLNADEMREWTSEQSKDLARLAAHMDVLVKSNEALKARLAECESLQGKMASAEKELKKSIRDEQDIRATLVRQYEKKLADQRGELDKHKAKLESELKQLQAANEQLTNGYDNAKWLIAKNEKSSQEMKAQSDKLAEEIERLQERAESADTKNSELSAQVEQMRRDLAQTSADLSSQKEQLSEALQREASLKLKHGILLESFDELTSKFDNSQRVLASKEESASRRLAELSGELESKKKQLESSESELSALKSSANELRQEANKLRANQTLLLTYPDLYGPIPQLADEAANEMHVCDEMINQCSANKLRIELLESLNRKLENSIKKLNENQVRINSTNSWQSRLDKASAAPSRLHNDRDKHSAPPSTLHAQQHQHEHHQSLEQLMQPAADSSYLTSTDPSFSEHKQQQPQQPKVPSPLQMQRPVPLFKLEHELVPQQQKQQSAKSRLEESRHSEKVDNLRELHGALTATSVKSVGSRKSSAGVVSHRTVPAADDDGDELDFLKDKRASDQNYLHQLHQIANESTRQHDADSDDAGAATPVAFNNSYKYGHNVNNFSGELSSFVRSTSQSSIHSDASSVPSRLSSFSTTASAFGGGGGHKAAAAAPSLMSSSRPTSVVKGRVIPPAEKNMEVIVGKGRRTTSANGPSSAKQSPSTRGGAATTTNEKTASHMPPSALPAGERLRSKTSDMFKCDACHKGYNNTKDFDIHKLYCNRQQ